MTSRSSLVRLQTSRALLAAVDQLALEFPEVPLAEIYVRVGEARVAAARRLPNVSAYRDALERVARAQLRFDYFGVREKSVAESGCGNG
jgi:hypothetical protein